MVSEYLKFPFELKVDYFILYSVLVSTFVIFLPFFALIKRRFTNNAEQFSPVYSNVYAFKRKLKITTAYQHVTTQFYEIFQISHIIASVR